jgi:hypothetical protein
MKEILNVAQKRFFERSSGSDLLDVIGRSSISTAFPTG